MSDSASFQNHFARYVTRQVEDLGWKICQTLLHSEQFCQLCKQMRGRLMEENKVSPFIANWSLIFQTNLSILSEIKDAVFLLLCPSIRHIYFTPLSVPTRGEDIALAPDLEGVSLRQHFIIEAAG